MFNRIFLVACLALLLPGLIACQRSVGTTDTTVPTTATYLFYAGELSAVDSENPSNPRAVETPGTVVTNTMPVEFGRFASSDSAISDRHLRAVLYRKDSDNTLWRVSALKGDKLATKQVSNANDVTVMCSSRIQTDFENFEASQLIYKLPGIDGNCYTVDDTWQMVTLSMDVNQSPIPAFEPMMAIYDVQTGAISGWLVKDSSTITAFDANFANPISVASFSSTAYQIMKTNDGRILLRIDNDLVFFRPSGNPSVLSGSMHTINGAFNGAIAFDNSYAYFRDETIIYRLALDENSSSSLVVDEGTTNLQILGIGKDRLIYSADGYLKSIPLSGGAATTISPTAYNQFVGISGVYVYYNIVYYNSIDMRWYWQAHVVMEDGSNHIERLDDAWVGRSEPTAYMLGNRQFKSKMDYVFLKEGADPPYSLSAYKADTHQLITQMGLLSTTMSAPYDPFIMRLPNQGFLLGRAYDSATSSIDIFSFNLAQNNSLVQVTSTGTTEWLVSPSGCSLQSGGSVDPVLAIILLLAGFGLRRRYLKGD